MGRGSGYSPLEEELLRENFDRTIVELEELLRKNGYARSKKSINRKLEKMREAGEIGLRSKDTVRRSYRQRGRYKHGMPTELEPESALTSGSSFADADWDDDGWLD